MKTPVSNGQQGTWNLTTLATNQEDRVREWFLDKALPPQDAIVEIPEDYFDPRFF
jgi:hypothetical protein